MPSWRSHRNVSTSKEKDLLHQDNWGCKSICCKLYSYATYLMKHRAKLHWPAATSILWYSRWQWSTSPSSYLSVVCNPLGTAPQVVLPIGSGEGACLKSWIVIMHSWLINGQKLYIIIKTKGCTDHLLSLKRLGYRSSLFYAQQLRYNRCACPTRISDTSHPHNIGTLQAGNCLPHTRLASSVVLHT